MSAGFEPSRRWLREEDGGDNGAGERHQRGDDHGAIECVVEGVVGGHVVRRAAVALGSDDATTAAAPTELRTAAAALGACRARATNCGLSLMLWA